MDKIDIKVKIGIIVIIVIIVITFIVILATGKSTPVPDNTPKKYIWSTSQWTKNNTKESFKDSVKDSVNKYPPQCDDIKNCRDNYTRSILCQNILNKNIKVPDSRCGEPRLRQFKCKNSNKCISANFSFIPGNFSYTLPPTTNPKIIIEINDKTLQQCKEILFERMDTDANYPLVGFIFNNGTGIVGGTPLFNSEKIGTCSPIYYDGYYSVKRTFPTINITTSSQGNHLWMYGDYSNDKFFNMDSSTSVNNKQWGGIKTEQQCIDLVEEQPNIYGYEYNKSTGTCKGLTDLKIKYDPSSTVHLKSSRELDCTNKNCNSGACNYRTCDCPGVANEYKLYGENCESLVMENMDDKFTSKILNNNLYKDPDSGYGDSGSGVSAWGMYDVCSAGNYYSKCSSSKIDKHVEFCYNKNLPSYLNTKGIMGALKYEYGRDIPNDLICAPKQ